MTAKLNRRLEQLKARTSPIERIRICWKGCEPSDLAPSDILYVLFWRDEGEGIDDAA